MTRTQPPAKESKLEPIKRDSCQLRGQIAQELESEPESVGKDSIQLLKFHGTYQQDDRDIRGTPAAGESGKAYTFMVRTKIPGGRLSAAQLLSELDLAEAVANGTLRITSRQGLQLHGVLKQNLRDSIHRINEVQLSTLGACGDVNRNVMCCPAPFAGPVHAEVQQLADDIAAHLAPRTTAYHELWLQQPDSQERQLVGGGTGEQVEPIYGSTYLPRKFKIGIGFPEDNCVDLYTHDLGLLAVVRDERIVGYNVLVGGGQGVTPSAKKTFPALAKRMAFVEPQAVLDVITAVVKVQRDFGNRSDRKVARLKYLIHNWGLDRFRARVEAYHGARLEGPRPDDVHGFQDHLGWNPQGDGRWFYGLNVENGRIQDSGERQIKTAVREICQQLRPAIRLTAHQSLLFTDLEAEHKGEIEDILRAHRVALVEEVSAVRRWSMACVAWPTCGLAITESERALPGIIDQLEVELAKLGLSREKFTVRMTGCPNGCARPYNSDIGIVGKAKGKYTIFVGGRLLGDRLNFVYKDLVPEEALISTLVPLMTYFKHHRTEGESFGDFCARHGKEDLVAWADAHAWSNSA